MKAVAAITLGLLCIPARAAAQQPSGDGQMQGMSMAQNGPMNMHPDNFVQKIEHHGTSGTSAEPNSTPMPMLMTRKSHGC